MATDSFARFVSRMDSDPRVRGKQWEHVCRWYVENAPEYRGRFRRVWLWAEWPGRWGADAGIDLVAETTDGDLWAIQAKAYDPAHSITKRDTDTFLAEAARPLFNYRLLIATTDRLGRTAQRTLESHAAGWILRSNLAVAPLDWPTSPSRLLAATRRPKALRRHQREALASIVEGLRTHDRGQVVMACGTGKTLVGLRTMESLAARRTLVLLPSLSLVQQTLREWRANATQEFEYLAVCSDATVAGEDAVVSTVSELGLPVTTETVRIASFLWRRHARSVVFATYQSSERIADAQSAGAPSFDLVVADEAHRSAGAESGVFATVLDGSKIRARKRLFLTATPRYYTQQVKEDASDVGFDLASMDNEQLFGPVLHRLTFAEAIRRKLLSDYQVVVVGVSDSTYRDLAERAAFITLDGKTITDARTVAAQIGLLRAMRRYELRRVVSFHSRIASARGFTQTLPEIHGWMPTRRRPSGSLWVDHVSGEMPSGQREARLQRLREVGDQERGVLTNSRCLAEGVDVPTLDGVAFINPRRSQIDIIQAVGRAIRKAPNKTLGTIVIPVFIEDGEDGVSALESGAFEPVWQILKALRAHDDVLGEELDELRRELGRTNVTGRRPAKIKLDVPVNVRADFARAFDALVVTQSTSSWEEMFGVLQRYVEREGHTRLPQKKREAGVNLGSWLSTQRMQYRSARLSADRVQRLETLPGWTWDVHGGRWEEGFSALLRFVAREGTARVPQDHIEGQVQLGRWLHRQRQAYFAGTLTQEREARLTALPGWTWEPHDARWESMLTLLQAFAEKNGHAVVPTDERSGKLLLGRWVDRQRAFYRKGELSPERAARLEALRGWTWNRNESAWDTHYQAVERFARREGHTRLQKHDVESELRIGMWAQNQRGKYNRGVLEPDRIARLEEVPQWIWKTGIDQWDISFSILERYAKRTGDCAPPQSIRVEGFALGRWVTKQRAHYYGGSLRPERSKRLEALPGWTWDPRGAAWERGFAALRQFQEENPTQRPGATTTVNGYRVGQWVVVQRAAHKRGHLAQWKWKRIDALAPGLLGKSR